MMKMLFRFPGWPSIVATRGRYCFLITEDAVAILRRHVLDARPLPFSITTLPAELAFVHNVLSCSVTSIL